MDGIMKLCKVGSRKEDKHKMIGEPKLLTKQIIG